MAECATIVTESDDSSASFLAARNHNSFWRRFLRNPKTLFGLIILSLLLLMAIFAPNITPGVTPTTSFQQHFEFLGVHGPSFDDFPALLFGNEPPDVNVYNIREFSVLAEITYGARVTLAVSIFAGLGASLIGAVIGALAGYFGGWLDAALSLVTDIFQAIPFIPLCIVLLTLSSLSYAGWQAFIVLFTLVGWPGIAHLVRANFLALRPADYTMAAQAVGIGHWRIITRHLLPNALPLMISATVLNMTTFLVAEATLEFLSVGATTTPTWGLILAKSYLGILTGSWWTILFPGLFIIITVLALASIGEGLRDTLDSSGRIIK